MKEMRELCYLKYLKNSTARWWLGHRWVGLQDSENYKYFLTLPMWQLTICTDNMYSVYI